MPLDAARARSSARKCLARTSIPVRPTPAKAEAFIYFECPDCGKRMRVRERSENKKGVCPACKARFTFPEASTPGSKPRLPVPDRRKSTGSGLHGAVPRTQTVSKPRQHEKGSQKAPPARLRTTSSRLEAMPVLSTLEGPRETARVLVGTLIGLAVGLFGGFVLGKRFAQENTTLPTANQAEAQVQASPPIRLSGMHETPNIQPPNLVESAVPVPPVSTQDAHTNMPTAELALPSAIPEMIKKGPEPATATSPVETATPSPDWSERPAEKPVVIEKMAAKPEPQPALEPDPAPAPEAKHAAVTAEKAIKDQVDLKKESFGKFERPVTVEQREAEPQDTPVVPIETDLKVADPTKVAVAEEPTEEAKSVEASQTPAKSNQPEAANPTLQQPEKPAANRLVFTTARAVHEFVDKRYQGDDGKYQLTLILVNKRGEERVSKMVRYRYERNHLSKILLTYASPSDVRGTTTMTIEQRDADDIQRIYIPSMKKNRRIASSDKGRAWAGTDFTYEDLQEHEIDDWKYGELKSDVVDGHECWYYVTTPVTPDKSCYTRIENWVRKDIMEPVRAKYWDEKDRYLKELNFRQLRKIQGIWSPLLWEMENVQENHKTVFKVEKVIYNTGLKEDMFTPRSMSSVPLDF